MQAKLKIFAAQSGQESARLEFPDGRRVHLHSTVAPERESESLQPVPIWGDTVVVLGVGLGYQLDGMDFGAAKRVVLVDVYDTLLERAAERLGPRVEGLACLNAREPGRLVQALKSVPNASLQLLRHPASLRAHPEIYEALERALLATRLTPANTPLVEPRKRRVLLMQGRYFLERELSEALEATAHLSVLAYRDLEEGPPREAAFQALIERERPELIVTIGFKGCDRQGRLLQMAQRYGIPVAVWFLDDPRPGVLAFESVMGPNVHAFVWDSAYAPWLEQRGFASVQVLPLGASAQVFSRPSRPGRPIPLSFVGSSLGAGFVKAIQDRFSWDVSMQPLVDAQAHALLAGEIDALSAAAGALPFEDEKNRVWLASVIIHTASHLKRVAVCQALLGEGLETIGDPESWQALLGPGVQCHEAVDYYTGLVDIYQHSAINLNITSCQMPTTVNQRLFDVPLAGGFLLTDPQADATALFEEGREVVVYRSIEEAVEMVRYFRDRPQIRAQITRAARERVLGEHLVSHRIDQILSGVFG
jgi:spore maturation protein CgeB